MIRNGSGSGQPVCFALFGPVGLILSLKRMAIKEQPGDGFGLEARCDHRVPGEFLVPYRAARRFETVPN